MKDIELTREDYEKIAKEKGFELTPFADKIIARVNACEGYCPCRTKDEIKNHPENNYECPCSMMEKDVREHNYCHCRLFCLPKKD